KRSLEMREKLNTKVEECETTNKLLTNQLDWYKKGWLTYHEYARNQINQSPQFGNIFRPSSIPMPPHPSDNPSTKPPSPMPPFSPIPPFSSHFLPPPPPPLLLPLPSLHPDPSILLLSINLIFPILPESSGLMYPIRKL
ncbi:hypothetical protein PENTCL1PPCAC_7312, partial [Pristionchus entomophagus]